MQGRSRFQNFGKCNLGECHSPRISNPGGVGTSPNSVPKRVCAAQQVRDFGTLSFTAKLGLSCCVSTMQSSIAGRLGK